MTRSVVGSAEAPPTDDVDANAVPHATADPPTAGTTPAASSSRSATAGDTEVRRLRRVVRRRRLPMAARSALSLLGVALAIIAVAGVGLAGLQRTHASTGDALSHYQDITDRVALRNALDAVARAAIEQTAGIGPDESTRVDTRLEEVLVPEVQRALATIRASTEEPLITYRLDEIDAGLDKYLRLRDAGAYDGTALTPPPLVVGGVTVQSNTLAITTAVLFEEATVHAQAVIDAEANDVKQAQIEADITYRSTRTLLLVTSALALVGGAVVGSLAIRNVVPRIRDYASFVAESAGGQPARLLTPRGNDELGDLGRALSAMVATAAEQSGSDEAQTEYIGALQVSSTEDEAHELVQRHLERAVPGSDVVVLKRNNSANRLLSATTLDEASPLVERLAGAEPRSCLAVRFGRTHQEGGGRAPLLSCSVCATTGVRSSCEPLLVGGEVIGAVLTNHDEQLSPVQQARIKTSVVQAAPVLANLRNLAVAEFRANNDSLTGLPNKRSTEDTVKRMVAQANRSVAPLAAVMVDLDHFKQINDTYGHVKGDEVLAAVGAALLSTVRTSDFAGRFGGEEFLLLLPETDVEGAYQVAEKVRHAIATTMVPGVERPITASLGIADLLRHGGNGDRLLREADRALYAAKSAGRNQTIVAAMDGLLPRSSAAPSS